MRTNTAHAPKPLTRREAVALISSETGLPLSLATLNRLCASGDGPPFIRWGNKTWFQPDDVRRWARDRARVQEAS